MKKFTFLLVSIVVLVFIALIFMIFLFVLNKDDEISNDDRDNSNNQICGIESCHGLDINCGTNVPEVCDAMYMPRCQI